MKTFCHTSFSSLRMFHDVKPVWCENFKMIARPDSSSTQTWKQIEVEYPHNLKEAYAIQLCSCPPRKKMISTSTTPALDAWGHPWRCLKMCLRRQHWHLFSPDFRDVYATAPDCKTWCQKATNINRWNLEDVVKFEVDLMQVMITPFCQAWMGNLTFG